VVKFLEFGFPINCQGNCSGLSSERNHTGATNFPDKMEKYLCMCINCQYSEHQNYFANYKNLHKYYNHDLNSLYLFAHYLIVIIHDEDMRQLFVVFQQTNVIKLSRFRSG
jgi:hypothetical protein